MKGLHEFRHPRPGDLALAARGDLSAWRRWQVQHHIRRCPICEHEVEEYRSVANRVKYQASLEALTLGESASEWQRLEREMTGNIKVGIAAAQCVGSVPARVFSKWRVPALVAGLSFIFVAGWLINVPRDDMDRIMSAFRAVASRSHPANGIVLETNPHGVSVRFQGASLTLLHPASARATSSFTSSSSVGVRYIDDETGQVTIANVYGQ